MAKTRAQANRAVRQEALRDQLASQGHVQHVVENIVKIEDLNPSSETFVNELNQLKTANDQRLKLIAKYIPDLKAAEITGEAGQDLFTKVIREIVDTKDKDS